MLRRSLTLRSKNGPMATKSVRSATIRMGSMLITRNCVIATAMAVLSVVGAAADENAPGTDNELARCAKVAADFTGSHPLTYAEISAGAKAPIRQNPPFLCEKSQDPACAPLGSVSAGDHIAVARVCGDWAEIQSIGRTHITIGWIDHGRLENQREVSSPPADVQYPSHFGLKLGSGRPVCEAYLQRLNQTIYSAPPRCGRPESNVVPGFQILQRVPMTLAEIRPLQPWMLSLLYPESELTQAELLDMAQAGGLVSRLPDQAKEEARKYYERGTSSWRYADPIDINNDEHPKEVIVWDANPGQTCGKAAHEGDDDGQIPFIVSSSRDRVDQSETIEVFGHPHSNLRLRVLTPSGSVREADWRYYRPIGGSYGILEYRKVFYFDTFFNVGNGLGDFNDARRKDPELPYVLGVFVRERGSTTEICEYASSPLRGE
jgi:hypothetical protein